MERLSKFLFNRGVFFTLKRFSASLHQRFGCWICRSGATLGTRFSEVRRQKLFSSLFCIFCRKRWHFVWGGEGKCGPKENKNCLSGAGSRMGQCGTAAVNKSMVSTQANDENVASPTEALELDIDLISFGVVVSQVGCLSLINSVTTVLPAHKKETG